MEPVEEVLTLPLVLRVRLLPPAVLRARISFIFGRESAGIIRRVELFNRQHVCGVVSRKFTIVEVPPPDPVDEHNAYASVSVLSLNSSLPSSESTVLGIHLRA
ncbi:hypothetical protein NMY22_g6944 [Coprinellus aureogranulatus]|nr:hypothetical protein NMY22_g6944 [Coprinellus aureogranulatus]